MKKFPFKLLRKLRALALNHLKPYCVLIDKDMKVTAMSGEAEFYGFADLSLGDDAKEQFPFLFDLGLTEEIRLPFVDMHNGHAAHVDIVPERNDIYAIFIDATEQRDQQRALQQKANELKLLTHRQEQLMQALRIARDDLAIKRRQAEESSMAKGRFISGMSHEFRTPLTSILGYVELLSAQSRQSLVASHLTAIERSARHLLSLIENVLDEARLERDELLVCSAPTDLFSMAEDISSIFKSLAAQKHLAFRLYKEVPQNVELDGVRLRQVLINLLGNAVKYTNEGAVTLELNWQENRLNAAVSDTGPGIPSAHLENIFKPFHRSDKSNHEGAGLGLAISKQLIELMGGQLYVESTPKLGSRFGFSIPATRIDQCSSAAQPLGLGTAEGHTTGKGRILLAEDNEDIVRLFELFLTDAGYEFISTADGQQAVNVALQERPDIVFMDLNLPVLNGLDATEKLRNARFLNPIIALTASPSKGDRRRALDAGCSDYLLKPIDMSHLLTITHELIAEKCHAVR